jgi:threonine aldolase
VTEVQSRTATAPATSLALDGPDLSPRAYAKLLAELTEKTEVGRDAYGLGGVVAEFEARMAKELGKERAILMPTGTLANNLALDLLCDRNRRRVLVQTDGHMYADTGDSAARLHNVVLIPAQDRGAGYSVEAMQAQLERAAGARVAVPFAAAVIETPVRRRFAQMIPLADMDAAVACAKQNGLKLHLDGARVYIAAAWTGRGVRDFCAPFDTVYVSLYKYFGAPFGAVLAGPAALIDGLYHDRRRHGGGLNHVWQIALVAGHFLDGMAERWRKVKDMAEPSWKRLEASGRFTIERIQDGSNIVKLRPTAKGDGEALKAFRGRAEAAGLKMPEPAGDCLPVRANETWLQAGPEEIANRLIAALG